MIAIIGTGNKNHFTYKDHFTSSTQTGYPGLLSSTTDIGYPTHYIESYPVGEYERSSDNRTMESIKVDFWNWLLNIFSFRSRSQKQSRKVCTNCKGSKDYG